MKRYLYAALIALLIVLGFTFLEGWVKHGVEEILVRGEELSPTHMWMIRTGHFWSQFRWFLIPVVFAVCVGGTLAFNIFRRQD